ncbi:MAG: fibronectin type III domain-containing protein [Saprospiraceae bacterium]
MKKKLLRHLLPALVAFVFLAATAQTQTCEFTLNMHDDFGDGWNGGLLTVVNSGNTYQFSLVNNVGNGEDSTVTFSVTAGLPIVLNWAPGQFNGEVSFSLFNNDRDLLFQATGPNAGLLYLSTAVCVDCVKPRNLVVENVWDNRARISWEPAYGNKPPVGWSVVYGPTGFVPGPSAGDTLYTATPKANITGLQPKTKYDFYVQQDCGNGLVGKLAGPLSFETYRTNDVGISAVQSPQNSCDLDTETLTVLMRNHGAAPQSLVRFNYSVNGTPSGVQQPQDGFFTGILGKDSTAVLTFQKKYDFSAPGEYTITAWTELADDEDRTNDTIVFRVVNRLVAPYSQNFETWTGGWYAEKDTALAENPSWQFGTPAGIAIPAAASGKNAWVTNLTGLYNADEIAYLNSPCFDFSDLNDDPAIQFSLIYDTESEYDGAWLEMSLNDGATWAKVGMLNEPINWYNEDNSINDFGHVWGGTSGSWATTRHLLDGAAGMTNVRLRFVFRSDEFVQEEGIGIDDIRVDVPVDKDLSALAVSTLADGLDCGLPADIVTVQVANLGKEPVSVFGVAYSLNAAAPVVENVGPVSLAPNEIYPYTFSQTFDSRDGKFDLRCWAILSGDQKNSNDTAAVLVVDHLPDPLPLREDFENGLPAGWVATGSVTDGHANVSNVLAFNLYNFNTSSSVTLPRVGFVGPNDSLSFDYRITDYEDEGTVATVLNNGTRFEVSVSTNCGSSFQPVYTINENNHVPSLGLQNIRIPLAAYAGKAVQIRIKGTWGAGDFFFDLDNVNLPQQGSSPTHEAVEGLVSLIIQPNPTTGQAILWAYFEQAVDAQVQMFNLAGRVVWQSNILHTDRLAEPLYLGDLPDGMYLVRLVANGQAAVQKLVLAK